MFAHLPEEILSLLIGHCFSLVFFSLSVSSVYIAVFISRLFVTLSYKVVIIVLHDWSLERQLIFFPENLSVSRDGGKQN